MWARAGGGLGGPTNANFPGKNGGEFDSIEGPAHETRPQDRRVMPKVLIRNHFYLMLPLGSEHLGVSDLAVASKCRPHATFFLLNDCRGPRCTALEVHGTSPWWSAR